MAIGNHGPSSLKGWRDGLYNSSSLYGRLGGSKRGLDWPKFRVWRGGPEGGLEGSELGVRRGVRRGGPEGGSEASRFMSLCVHRVFLGSFLRTSLEARGVKKRPSVTVFCGFSVDPSGPPLPFSPIKLLIKEPHLDPPWTPPPDP